MCYILAPLQDVFSVVSIVTQTVLVSKRCRAIVLLFKTNTSLRRVKTSVCVIWIATYVEAGLLMMVFLKNKPDDKGYYYYLVHHADKFHKMAHIVYLVVLFLAMPVVIESVAYLGVIPPLRAKTAELASANSLQSTAFKNCAGRNKHLIKMLLVIMLADQACSIPRLVVMLVKIVNPETFQNKTFLLMDLSCNNGETLPET